MTPHYALLTQLLDAAEAPILVQLDARMGSAVVPPHLKDDLRLVLRVGWNLEPPITDLQIHQNGFSATLHFNGAPFWCSVGWSAIYAVQGTLAGRNLQWTWPKLIPPDYNELYPDVGPTPTQTHRKTSTGKILKLVN